jgi:hypothetical protein
MLTSIIINGNQIDLSVDYGYSPACPATASRPADEEWCEVADIRAVAVREHGGRKFAPDASKARDLAQSVRSSKSAVALIELACIADARSY